MDLTDDPLLARAQLLLKAARQTSELLKPIEREIPQSLNKNRDINANNKNDNKLNKIFRASVFKGSTLINTHDDIRQSVGRGDQILVDGVCCTIAQNGEWSSTCIEITNDFPGDTNFSASLSIATANNILNSPKRKKPMVPVSTDSIKQAVEQLTSFKELYSSKIESSLDQIHGSKGSGKQPEKPKNGKKPPAHKAAVRDSYSAPYEYQPPFASSSSGDYEEGQEPSPCEDYHTYSSTTPYDEKNYKNPSDNMGIASRMDRLNIDNSHTQHLTEPERENLVTRQIAEFNEQRQQQNKNAVDPQKLAKMRIQQKIREDAKVKELQELDVARKKAAEGEASALKVQTLQAKTEQRVARYKESLLRKEQEEREKTDLELHVRKEREKEAFSESKRSKLVALRKESVKRLRQIEEEDERRELERHVAIQAKLDLISKKFDVNSTFLPAVPPPGPAPSGSGRRVSARVDGKLIDTVNDLNNNNGANNNKPRSLSTIRKNKDTKQVSSLPPIMNGSGALTERSRSEHQTVRPKNKTQPLDSDYLQPIVRSHSTSNAHLLQYKGESNDSRQQQSHNSGQSASHHQQRYRDTDDDEWSDDGDNATPVYGRNQDHQKGSTRSRPYEEEDSDLDEDSIDLSRGQSRRVKTGNGGIHNTANANNKPSYNYGDNNDDGDLSDISGEGNPPPKSRGVVNNKTSNAKSAAALPVMSNPHQKILPAQVNVRVESSSRIPMPSSVASSSSNPSSAHGQRAAPQQNNGRSKVKNSPSGGIIPLVQINQQQIQQQQQHQYTASSPTDSSKRGGGGSYMSSYSNKNAVWRKLKPIPILPYKPVPVGDN